MTKKFTTNYSENILIRNKSKTTIQLILFVIVIFAFVIYYQIMHLQSLHNRTLYEIKPVTKFL